MHTHPNARLTAGSRERLVRRNIQDAEPLADLATQAGISLRTAYNWLARYRSGGRAPRFQERCHPFDQYTRGLEDRTNASLQRGCQS